MCLSPSARRPLFVIRSVPRYIILVACYGIFTVQGNATHDLKEARLIHTMFSILVSLWHGLLARAPLAF